MGILEGLLGSKFSSAFLVRGVWRSRKTNRITTTSNLAADALNANTASASFISQREGSEQIGDASYYSLTTEILPPLGARSNRRVRLRRFIVSPYDPRYRLWELFLVLLVLYTAWVSPFEFGFLNKPTSPLSTIDNIVNAFFLLDIILTFFVAYLDNSTYLLVDEPKKIAMKYAFSLRMAFDIISTLPYEFVAKVLPASKHVYGLYSMLRLWRLHRVGRLFSRFEKDRNFNYFGVRCVKLILVTLFSLHCSGCFYFHIAAGYHDPKQTWIGVTWGKDFKKLSIGFQYILSVYWAITTLSTVGYGDLHPVNRLEMLYTIFYMLFNIGQMSYLIGNMTNLVAHASVRTRLYRDSIQAASNFAQRHQLPYRLQEQMLAHICLKYRTNSEGMQQQEILESLPKAIRSSISHYLFYSLVDKVYLFRGVSNDLLFQLVSEMKAEFYSTNEDVILQNETPTDFYVIVSGTVDLIQVRNGVEQVLGEAKKGDLVGEISVLCYRPQIFTVRTKRLCQLLRINRNKFLTIVLASIGDGTIIMNNLFQHLKDQKNPIMERILVETENMMSRGRLDLINLCFAALKGNDSLMHMLLKRGLDPNESEESGRTALHVAASNGSEKCVHLLLDYSADPNCRDREGSTPLWEAMLGGRDSVVRLLREYGADINAGDVGQFACIAAHQNNLELLKRIVQVGGDLTQPSVNDSETIPEVTAGATALHVAVCGGYLDIVKYLVEQGCDIDRPNKSGWTPRELADQQDHEEIKSLFESKAATDSNPQPASGVTAEEDRTSTVQFLGRFKSEPILPQEDESYSPFLEKDVSEEMEERKGARTRRRTNNFRNSLFGVVSAAHVGQDDDPFPGLLGGPRRRASGINNVAGASSYTAGAAPSNNPTRVSISCPQKGKRRTLIIVPDTFEGLLEMASQKFGVDSGDIEVEVEDGSNVDCLDVIRDGDHLVIVPKSRN